MEDKEDKVALELKEIEGLLQAGLTGGESEPEDEKGFKKYVKLVLPHVALVVVVGLYAVIGAFIFLSVESPHEDQAKAKGVRNIVRFRELLIETMWNSSRSDGGMEKDIWMNSTTQELNAYTQKLYDAFKKEFVDYKDVKIDKLAVDGNVDEGPVRRGRRDGRKLWTTSSSIFFAATTMATIGYGNIVPVTTNGRVICVFFALFGAPLAIITIGDLGKFLSECTIHLYKQLKAMRAWCTMRWRAFRGISEEVEEEKSLEKAGSEGGKSGGGSETSSMGFSDLITDKTQVPVLLVFTILLIYIALGAILFQALEGWTYVDSFYFCFITLTTVGFGDLVPEHHTYIVIMLLYIGIGLSVTTMCIDLVGIQYIQKIHYFGRKFRGADLLQMLKRKRIMERKLALARNEGMIQAYLEKFDNPSPQWKTPSPSSVYSTPKWEQSEVSWEVDNVFTYEVDDEEPKTPSPMSTCPSVRQRALMYYDPAVSIAGLSSPSGPDISLSCSLHTSPSVHERFRLYERFKGPSISSWSQSGPDLSLDCTISTPPSEYEREGAYYNWVRSPSAQSYEFEFPPDYAAIAKAAREARRVRSCPDRIVPPSPPSPLGLSSMELWNAYKEMEAQSQLPVQWDPPEEEEEDIGPPSLLSPMDLEPDFPSSAMTTPLSSPAESELDFGAFEITGDSNVTAADIASKEEPLIYHENLPVHSVHHQTVKTETAVLNLMSCPEMVLSDTPPPIVVEDNYCFAVDGTKIRLEEVLGEEQWWRNTSRPTKYYYSDDLLKFSKVNVIQSKGKIISARFPKTKGAALHIPHSASQGLSPSTSLSHGISAATARVLGTPETEAPLHFVFKVIRMYSFWKTCTSFHRIVTVVSPVDDSHAAEHLKKRIFVQYLWRNAKESDKKRVAKEFDPKKHSFLKQVTDPSSRKKSFHT